MKITYDDKKDTLLIHVSDKPIIGILSYSKQVNVKLTKTGIGQITIREVKSAGLLPIEIIPNELVQIGNQPLQTKSKPKKKCCKKYKKGKQCRNCPKIS